MALYFTNTVKIKPGHMEEALALAPKIVPIYEKHGMKFHGAFQAVGGEANVLVYLVSIPGFAAWEDLIQKMQADTEFQATQREGRDHLEGSVIQALMPMPGSPMQ